MNASDIVAAVSAGYHPAVDPAGFFQASEAASHRRRYGMDEMRVRNLTSGHGFALSRKWHSPGEMLGELGIRSPVWLGGCGEVEEWVREGADPVLVLRPRTGNHSLSAFRIAHSGKWTRIV